MLLTPGIPTALRTIMIRYVSPMSVFRPIVSPITHYRSVPPPHTHWYCTLILVTLLASFMITIALCDVNTQSYILQFSCRTLWNTRQQVHQCFFVAQWQSLVPAFSGGTLTPVSLDCASTMMTVIPQIFLQNQVLITRPTTGQNTRLTRLLSLNLTGLSQSLHSNDKSEVSVLYSKCHVSTT